MKAVILCAGKGTRLYPVTLTMPKPLVPVANKELLRYAIETLTDMGATEIGLVVDSLDSPIRDRLGDGLETVGVPLTYIAQENPRGLAHAVKLCEPFVNGESFIVYLGDQLGVGGQLSTGVVVVLGVRIFGNVAAIRRHLFKA